MNGKHELRLERIEEMLRELHGKVDAFVEQGAVNRTDILWLKWAVRLLVAGLAGVGVLTVPGAL